jgi:hypothetical protein
MQEPLYVAVTTSGVAGGLVALQELIVLVVGEERVFVAQQRIALAVARLHGVPHVLRIGDEWIAPCCFIRMARSSTESVKELDSRTDVHLLAAPLDVVGSTHCGMSRPR